MYIDKCPDYFSLIKLISDKNPSDGDETGGLESRIQKISAILWGKHGLKEDSDLTGQIWIFTEKNNNSNIEKLREKLIFDTSCNIETLTLSENELKEFGANFWDDVIKKHYVKKLVIRGEGNPIVYGQRVLRQLTEKKLPIETLTEMYSLIFEESKGLIETKATLLLCGRFLEGLFELDNSANNKFDFSASPLTCDDFKELLKEVKGGKGEMAEELYEVVCDFLDYSRWTCYPEGAFGPEQWEEYYGLQVAEVPDVPQNILDRLKNLKKEGTQCMEKLILIPKGMSLDKMGGLAANPKNENKTSYRGYTDDIKRRYGSEETEKSYWALMKKVHFLPAKGHARQLEMAKEKERYDAPSLLEAVILNFTTYASTKQYVLSNFLESYTVCREGYFCGYRLAVGGFGPRGLYVNTISNDDDSIGHALVAPVLREF